MYAHYVIAVLSLLTQTACLPASRTPRRLPTPPPTTEVVPNPLTAKPNQPDATASYPVLDRTDCGAREGHRRLRGKIDRAVVATARDQLKLPMGSGRVLYVQGRRYLFCLEPHYHEPGSGLGPDGWHKGVTVYETT